MEAFGARTNTSRGSRITNFCQDIIRIGEHNACIQRVDAWAAKQSWATGLKRYAAYKGWHISAGLIVALSACAVLLGAVCSWALTGVWVLGVVVGVAEVAALARLPRRAAHLYDERVARQMTEAFRSSTVALRAGKSLAQTVSYVAERIDNPLKQVFLEAAFQYSMGRGQRATVCYLQQHLRAPGARLFGSALQIALLTGSGVEQVFERAGISLEKAQRQERELHAKTAQARLSAQVVGLMPLFLVIALCALSSDFRAGVNSIGGGIALVMAAALDLLGLALIQRIMRRALPRKEDW